MLLVVLTFLRYFVKHLFDEMLSFVELIVVLLSIHIFIKCHQTMAMSSLDRRTRLSTVWFAKFKVLCADLEQNDDSIDEPTWCFTTH